MAGAKAHAHFVQITREQAKLTPDGIAMWFEGRETTFRQLDERASQIANGLIDAGVTPGERVAFLGKNMDVYYEILFGVVKARGAMTGTPPSG